LREYMNELNSRLYDIEELYNTAQTLQLWDLCLSLFHHSGETNREDIIATLYRNLFRSIIATCKRQGNAEWTDAVALTVQELAAKYCQVDFMWPLDLIVQELEYNNYKFNAEPNEHWVVDTLLSANISTSSLIDAYTHVIRTIHPTDTLQQRLLIFKSVLYLLKIVLHELQKQRHVMQYSRHHAAHQHTRHSALHITAATIHPLISNTLQQLKDLPYTDSEVDNVIENLIQELQQIQQQLRQEQSL